MLTEALAAHAHLRTSDPQEREMRKALYKALIEADVGDVVSTANHLQAMLELKAAGEPAG